MTDHNKGGQGASGEIYSGNEFETISEKKCLNGACTKYIPAEVKRNPTNKFKVATTRLQKEIRGGLGLSRVSCRYTQRQNQSIIED